MSDTIDSEVAGTCYHQRIMPTEVMLAKLKWMCTSTMTWSPRETALSSPGLPFMSENGEKRGKKGSGNGRMRWRK